jgi:hypothetical protein
MKAQAEANRTIMATGDISDAWRPTAENVKALPGPLRRYIHDLQTNVELVETMRENFRLWQENAALRRKLTGTLSEIRPFLADQFPFGPKSLNSYGDWSHCALKSAIARSQCLLSGVKRT